MEIITGDNVLYFRIKQWVSVIDMFSKQRIVLAYPQIHRSILNDFVLLVT